VISSSTGSGVSSSFMPVSGISDSDSVVPFFTGFNPAETELRSRLSKAEARFRPDAGKTPKDAVQKFLKDTNEFKIDKTRNKIISMNPDGYLKRC
jgi:hypothetical protein